MLVTDDDFFNALKTALKGAPSQVVVAQRAGMSQGHLSKIVCRKVPLTDKARGKLIDALGLSKVGDTDSVDSLTRLNGELQALPEEMREPVGSALLAALDVLLSFRVRTHNQ